MTYPHPALWNACVAIGWATPETCSPAEFTTCVAAGENYHAGKGRMNKYAKKATKKITKGELDGNSVVPRLRERLIAVHAHNLANIKAEQAKKDAAAEAQKKRQAETETLRAKLNDVTIKLSTVSNQLAASQKSRMELQTRVTDLTAELKKETGSKQALEAKADELARKLETAQGNIAELAREFRIAREEARARGDKVQSLESLMGRISVETASLNESCAKQTAQLNQLQRSQTEINALLRVALS